MQYGRRLFVVGIILVAMMIAACTPVAPAPEGETTPAGNVAQVIELTYWHTNPGSSSDAQQELVKRFNASQDRIHVTAEFQGGYGDLATNILTAYAAGGGPDVSQLGTFEILQFGMSGVLTDLTGYMAGANGIDTSDWPGTMLSAGEVEGKIYWLPFNVSVPVLYYNTEAFAAAGLDGPPETWTDFYDYARKLTVKDDNGVVRRTGTALWGISWPLLSTIWSEGGELTTKDYSSITLNDPVAVDVMTRFQELIEEGAATLPDSASGGHRGAFMNGQAAMILDSPAPFGEIFAQSVGFTPDVANYPAGKEGKIYAPGGGGIGMISTTPAEKRDAAWEFIRYMLSPESIAYFAERSGYAAFYGRAQAAAGDLLNDPRYATIHAALPFLRGDFSMNTSPAVRTAFDEALQKIFVEAADVKTTLDAAEAKAVEGIKEENFAP